MKRSVSDRPLRPAPRWHHDRIRPAVLDHLTDPKAVDLLACALRNLKNFGLHLLGKGCLACPERHGHNQNFSREILGLSVSTLEEILIFQYYKGVGENPYRQYRRFILKIVDNLYDSIWKSELLEIVY